MEKKLNMESDDTCNKSKPETSQELTREQLVGMLHQMSEQDRKLFEENKKLREIIEEMNRSTLFKRLDYLFKIIDEDNRYLPEDFKTRCGKEITVIMEQPEQEQ